MHLATQPSAGKHGISDADIRHAVDHALAWTRLEEEPERWLVLGFNRAVDPLEIIVLIKPSGARVAIHAMPLRRSFHHLLP